MPHNNPPNAIKILLADDDIIFLKTTAALLELDGYQIVKATNSIHTLALLTDPDLRLDLVICDLHLQPDGWKVLLGSDFARHLPIILLSGLTTPDVYAEARQNGVNDIIQKPFEWEELQTAIRKAISLQ